jgi:high-affinity Fe2+/Pb2+ permease
MELITSFVISVIASVVANYICKWLDRNDRNK